MATTSATLQAKNTISSLLPEITVKNVTMQFKRAKDEATSLKELIIRSVRGKRKY